MVVEQRKSGSDSLGRYYTKAEVGSFLIDQMNNVSPRHVLDLGAGDGSLSRAVLTRWKDASLLTVDIDKQSRQRLKESLSTWGSKRHNHIQADALSFKLPHLLGSDIGPIDMAVCNPPFVVPRWRRCFSEIVEAAGFSSSLSALPDVDAALVFLAQNLRLIGQDASLGIILPDSLISSVKYRSFREELLERFEVRKAIRLPRCSFLNTDAQAFVLVIGNNSPRVKRVALQALRSDRSLSAEYLIDFESAAVRLDFDFHAAGVNRRTRKKKQTSLAGIQADVKRGLYTSVEARMASAPVLHTTDLDSSITGVWCDFRNFGTRSTRQVDETTCAAPGDILIARVGRNLETKIVGVALGYPRISDCIYRIRVPEKYRDDVLRQLSSKSGRAWIASRAYGVSARHLTKVDLLSFPIVHSS